MDLIMKFQEEENSKIIKEQPKQLKIKFEWTCQDCTLVNNSPDTQCQVCSCKAPPDAYYSEEELKA